MRTPTRSAVLRFLDARAPVLIRLLVAAVGATPLVWFHYDQMLKTVDSFFPVHFLCCDTSGFFSWDARVGTGLPTNLAPIAVFDYVVSWFATHVSVSLAEAGTLALLGSLAAVGMALLAEELIRVLQKDSRRLAPLIAGGIAGVFWVVNPFALSYVWYHTLFLEATWAEIPWLLYVLLRATRSGWSLTRTLLTTLAISLVGAPGILEVYIPSTAALLLVMAVSTVTVFRDSAAVFWEQARRQIAGLLGIGLGQAWWLLPAVPALHSLYAQATTTGDSSLDSLRYASQFTSLEHVVTLTGVPQIYATYGDGRYISWGSTVTSMPGRVLIWVAPVVALIGVADLLRRRRSRLAGLAIAIGLLVGIFVAKGAHSPFGGFNLRLLSLPFGNVLRHPVDKISPLLVPLVTLLFALGLGTLSRARLARVSVLAAAVVPCLWLAVPWYSGSVMPQASGPLPSSWAEVPASYQQAGKVLSALPTGGKTMVLPFSVDGFAAFRWPSGVQPNLDCLFPSWAPTRSTLCEDSGFGPADRVGNMLSAATAADDYRTFALARIFGVDSWLVHKDWDAAYVSEGQNTAAASVAFLQDPTGVSSGTAQPSTYPLGPGQSVRLSVRVAGRAFGSAPLVAMGQARLQANEASDHHKIFFALNDPAHGLWLPGVSVSRRASHIVTVTRVRTGVEFSVDGVVQHGGYRIPPGSATGEADQLLPALTSIPDFQAFVAVPAPPPGIDVAVRSDAGRAGVSGPVPATAVDTNELAMWRQDALPLLYAPSSVGCTSAAASKDLASLAWRLRSDPAPVVVAQRDCDPAGTATVGWSRQSPTDYSGSLSVHGSGWLVFGQTYDKDWSLSLSSDHVRTVKHLMVNGYANAWQLSGDGTVRFSLRYGLQTPVTVGFIAAGVLFCACLVAGGVAARKVVSGKRGRS